MRKQQETEPPVEDHTGAAVLRLIEEVTRDIPPEAWESLPRDLAEHFEEYMYGDRPWPQ